MFGKEKPEVLVVGAGPVGLIAALTLVRRGAHVLIADQAWRPVAHAYGLALHPDAMKLLRELETSDRGGRAPRRELRRKCARWRA